MADPADIEEQRRTQEEIEAAAIALEVAVLAVIARRLKSLEGVSSAYSSMPQDIAEIRAILESGSANLQRLSDDAIRSMARANDEWAKRFYSAMGVGQTSAMDHARMSAIIKEQSGKAAKEIEAACRSTVIEILDTGTGELLPIEEAYKRIIGNAATQMATGTVTGEQAIAEATKQLSKSGLKVAYPDTYKKKITDSTGKVIRTVTATRERTLTRNLYSSVSMNVMDAYRTCMGELRQVQGQEFGADGYEITAHALCAEDHLPYQGEVYTMKEFREIQSELARPIEIGANCGHSANPVIYSIAKENPSYSRSELRELRDLSRKEVTVTGLSGDKLNMTRYEASQYQRRIETSIRDANIQRYLKEQAGEDTTALKKAIKDRVSEYERISGEAGLSTRMERTRAYIQR